MVLNTEEYGALVRVWIWLGDCWWRLIHSSDCIIEKWEESIRFVASGDEAAVELQDIFFFLLWVSA